jgi:hypothetical protein
MDEIEILLQRKGEDLSVCGSRANSIAVCKNNASFSGVRHLWCRVLGIFRMQPQGLENVFRTTSTLLLGTHVQERLRMVYHVSFASGVLQSQEVQYDAMSQRSGAYSIH